MFVSVKHLTLLLILTLIFVKMSQTFHIVAQDYNTISQLDKCIVKIIENFPGIVRKISFLTSDGNSDSISAGILRDIRVPVLIGTSEDQNKKGAQLRIYNTLVIIKMENLNVTWVLRNVLWNSDTKFFVVTDVEKIDFRDFWRESVMNAFVLSEDAKGVSLYSFVPYNSEACDDMRPTLLDEWRGDNFMNGGLSELYDNQRIKDMHQCIVNISVIDLKPTVFFTDGCVHNCSSITGTDGAEARLMKVIAEKFNFIGRFSTPADGERFGSIIPPTGILGEVYRGRSKFGFGSITPVIERLENLDLSRFYRSKSCVTFIVPVGAGRDRLAWLKSIKSRLTLLQWKLIALSLVCVVIIFWIASNFTLSKSFLYAFQILMGLSAEVPEGRSLKSLMLFWIIFSFLVTNIYQASIGSEVIVPIKPPEINTLLELAESNLLIMGRRNLYAISRKIESIPGLKEINQRFIVTNINVDDIIQRMVTKRDIAVGGHKSTYIYALTDKPKAKGKIRTLKECAYDYYSTIILQKHSPFTRRTNIILGRVFDSGLSYYWRSLFVRKIPPETERFSPMRLKQSWGIIAILLSGLSISFLVFVMEVIVKPKEKKRMRRMNMGKKNFPKRPFYFVLLNR